MLFTFGTYQSCQLRNGPCMTEWVRMCVCVCEGTVQWLVCKQELTLPVDPPNSSVSPQILQIEPNGEQANLSQSHTQTSYKMNKSFPWCLLPAHRHILSLLPAYNHQDVMLWVRRTDAHLTPPERWTKYHSIIIIIIIVQKMSFSFRALICHSAVSGLHMLQQQIMIKNWNGTVISFGLGKRNGSF